jgi:hypothetical protein
MVSILSEGTLGTELTSIDPETCPAIYWVLVTLFLPTTGTGFFIH